MEVQTFIENFRNAFGESVELPVVFWYSDLPAVTAEKMNGCFFKGFGKLRKGEAIVLSGETLGCMGGKFYTGFSEMNERIPNFVSLKEKYKKTPEMVTEFIKELNVPLAEKKYLNISPIDKTDSFENILGVVFFETRNVIVIY